MKKMFASVLGAMAMVASTFGLSSASALPTANISPIGSQVEVVELAHHHFPPRHDPRIGHRPGPRPRPIHDSIHDYRPDSRPIHGPGSIHSPHDPHSPHHGFFGGFRR